MNNSWSFHFKQTQRHSEQLRKSITNKCSFRLIPVDLFC